MFALVAGLALGSPAAVAQEAPRPCAPTGELDYYRCRAADAEARRPDRPLPSYYLAYGDRYARRFTEETRPLLSPEGQRWLDRTRQGLQAAMEARRAANPAAFAALETDEARFLDFAYSTHPAAYLAAGLAALPLRDLVLIVTTPDAQELFTARGMAQIGEVLDGLLGACRASGATGCAAARLLIEARERRRLLSDRLGVGPATDAGRFLVRRIVGSVLRALGVEPAPPTPGLVGALPTGP